MTQTERPPLDQLAVDLLTTAVEGGINYWAEIIRYRWDVELLDDVFVELADKEDDESPVTRVSASDLLVAVQSVVAGRGPSMHNPGYQSPFQDRLALYALAVARNDREGMDRFDFDAWDADCLLQYAVFKDVIYG